MEKFLIFDGSAVLHRAYHALPSLTNTEGVPTNALYGFAKMVITLREIVNPRYLTVCFDTPVPSFRKKLLATYQSQRPKMADEFKVQIPLAQGFCEKAKISKFLKEGFEADDIIGTIVHRAQQTEKELHIYIFTGDKDLLQFVNQTTTVIMPKVGVSQVSYMDENAVEVKLGVGPKFVVDYKALIGDSSDNYGGVKGIGPKRAQELLKKYNSLENIYANISELDRRTKELLTQNKESAFLSQNLAQIRTNVDFDFQLSYAEAPSVFMSNELSEFLDTYSLFSVKKQLLQKKTLKESTKQPVVDKQDTNQLSFF